MQTCNECGIQKPLSHYHKHSLHALGVRKKCKQCACAATKKWYSENKEHHIGNCKKWQEQHPGAVETANKKYEKSQQEKKTKFVEKHLADNSKRETAQLITKYLMFKGELAVPDCCKICADKRGSLTAHHHDFSKPDDVVWLCGSCLGWVQKKYIKEQKVSGVA